MALIIEGASVLNLLKTRNTLPTPCDYAQSVKAELELNKCVPQIPWFVKPDTLCIYRSSVAKLTEPDHAGKCVKTLPNTAILCTQSTPALSAPRQQL